MAYLTKNPDGVVFLWNNKPEYNAYGETFIAWLPGQEGYHNEIPIDVTNNNYFRNMFIAEPTPCCMELQIKGKII